MFRFGVLSGDLGILLPVMFFTSSGEGATAGMPNIYVIMVTLDDIMLF